MSLPSLPFLLLHALNDEIQFARLVLRSVSATAGKIFLPLSTRSPTAFMQRTII
jgi:hypothetical protein